MTLMPFEFRDLSCYTPCNRTSNARGIIFRRKERKNTQQMQHQHASHQKEKKEKNAVMLMMHVKKSVPNNLDQLQEFSCPFYVGKSSVA